MSFKSVSIDAVNRTSEVHEYASGKSTNVARVVHGMGEAAMAITFVGGMRGRAFRDDLVAAGIAHDLIEVEPQTRMAITMIDRGAGTATELLEESRELRPADYEAMLAVLSRHLPAARVFVISGTLPPEAPADFYAQCVKLAEPKVPVILDAVGEPLLKSLEHRPWIVKPNRSEVARTLGISIDSDQAIVQASRRLIDRGAQAVVITNGAKETLLNDGRRCWRITAPSVQVVSAIGSGDAFAGGMAVSLALGNDLPTSAAFGAANGTANALTPHAGHVNTADAAQLFKQVQIQEM